MLRHAVVGKLTTHTDLYGGTWRPGATDTMHTTRLENLRARPKRPRRGAPTPAVAQSGERAPKRGSWGEQPAWGPARPPQRPPADPQQTAWLLSTPAAAAQAPYSACRMRTPEAYSVYFKVFFLFFQ